MVRALYNKALVLGKLGRHDDALEAIETAAFLQPTPLALFRKGMILIDLERCDEALELFDRLVEIAPDVAVFYHRARIFHAREEHAKAVADLTEALRHEPHDDAALLLRARCYEAMEQYDKAFGDFAQALYFMPDHIGALHGRASLYFERQQFELAIKDETRALSRNPDFQQGYVLRSRSWAGLAEEAKRSKTGVPVSVPELAEGKFFVADRCWRNVFADLDRALELDSGDLTARWHRGFFAHRTDAFEKAVEDFTVFLQAAPDDPSALYWRGWARICLGDDELALLDFDRLIAVDPMNWTNFYARSRVKKNLGFLADAEQDFQKATELRGDEKEMEWQ